jgi:hypothetical protein
MSATFAEQLAAWSTAATAVLTLVLVVAAFKAWSTAKDTLKASRRASEAAEAANEQARLDSIERTRPYVFVEILPGLAGVATFDIRISNSGQSAARDLTLDYDAWPDELDDVAEMVRTLFGTPRSLPPGTSLRAMWRLTGNLTDGKTEAGLGTAGTITASYTSSDPAAPRYTEQFDVPIANSGYWPVPEEGARPDDLQGDARRFYKLAQVLVRRIGELGR